MSAERIIGVDFGTSTSVIRVKSYENNDYQGQNLDTKEVVFGEMSSMVPTLIQKKDDAESIAFYGFEAQQKKKKSTTYHSFKVDLESRDPDKRFLARQLTEEFFQFMAKTYKAQSEGGHLGKADDRERTIVSYPVKWSEETRQFMIKAAEKAGFPNVTGIDEAQAAIHAVAVQSTDYLKQHGLLVKGVPANVLLIDMGAGTTDLVLCRYIAGGKSEIEILNTWPKGGEVLFGGKEVDYLLQGFFRNLMQPEEAEKALKSIGVNQFKTWKEESVSPALSQEEAVTDFYAMDNYADIVGIEIDDYKLDRAAFEQCLGDYLKQLPVLICGCLQDAGMKGSDVDLVIVTGGHSKWYFVREMLMGKMPQFGEMGLTRIMEDPSRIIPVARPQETVALGLVYSPIPVKVVVPVKPVTDEPRIEPSESYEESDLERVEIDNKFGFKNKKTNKLLIPCQWDSASLVFQNGLVKVGKDQKYGYIDKTGKLVIPCHWEYASYIFQEGFAVVGRNKKYGFIDKTGELVIPCQWDKAYEFSEGLAVVQKDGKYGYIDKTGNLVSPCQWEAGSIFREGLALVKKNDKYGYIDKTGRVVIPFQWDNSYVFSEGLAAVVRNNKFGFIDKTGNLVIPCQWDGAGGFSEGLSVVVKNNKFGFIDKTGNLVIPCQWDDASGFRGAFAKVRKVVGGNEEEYVIDKAGRVVHKIK